MMKENDRIYIAGHNGMVGSAIVRGLKQRGFNNLICRTSKELDLRNQQAVDIFFAKEKPEYVFLAAAKVGGIVANNTYRATFLYDNLMIAANIIHAAFANKVTKLLFLGSSIPTSSNAILIKSLTLVVIPVAITKSSGFSCCNISHMAST